MSRPHRQSVTNPWRKCGENVTGPKSAEFRPYNGRNPPMATVMNSHNLPFSSTPRFRGVGPVRAVLEAAIGCAALLFLTRLLQTAGDVGAALAHVTTVFAWLWLWIWPAWSLAAIPRPWRTRLPLAVARGIVVGLALTATALIF